MSNQMIICNRIFWCLSAGTLAIVCYGDIGIFALSELVALVSRRISTLCTVYVQEQFGASRCYERHLSHYHPEISEIPLYSTCKSYMCDCYCSALTRTDTCAGCSSLCISAASRSNNCNECKSVIYNVLSGTT